MLLQARFGLHAVGAVQQGASESAIAKGAHFLLLHREGWTLLLLLRILERQGKALRALGQQLGQLCVVAHPRLGRQGDLRGAVVPGGHSSQVFLFQGEEVAAEQIDLTAAPTFETPLLGAGGAQSGFTEEGGDGLFDDLIAGHEMALLRQPMHVQGLAAQRHEDMFVTLQP